MNGRTVIPLTRQPGAVQVWKIVIPTSKSNAVGPGEVAEFDTRVPHRFGSNGQVPAEVLSVLGRQGERMHVRARTRSGTRRS